jgi:hypothetical protein
MFLHFSRHLADGDMETLQLGHESVLDVEDGKPDEAI